MKSRQSAFTLIEVIMATTLSAMVLTAAFASLSILLKAYRQQEGMYSATDTANLILNRMVLDLNSAFFSPHQEMTRFVVMDQQEGNFDTDSLTFISTINKAMQTGEGTSDMAEVQYYIDLDEATPERWLLRRIDATPDNDPFTGGTIALFGPQVVSLDFQCYDGTEWWPMWNSSGSIPIAVNVTIGIYKPRSIDDAPSIENIQFFSKMIWLASYRQSSKGPIDETTPEEDQVQQQMRQGAGRGGTSQDESSSGGVRSGGGRGGESQGGGRGGGGGGGRGGGRGGGGGGGRGGGDGGGGNRGR